VIESLATRLESERDRWILWTPVAVAAGDGLYFSLSREPSLWQGFLALAFSGLALILWRGRRGWPVLAGLALVALGFCAAELRSHSVAAPILVKPLGIITLWGRVVAIEPTEGGSRVVLDHLSGSGIGAIERVRIRLRGDYGVRPGERIRLRASLMPPPPPMVPGGYDFSRQAWFQRLGAVGYSIGRPVVIPTAPTSLPFERFALALEESRQTLSQRIVGAIDHAGFNAGIGVVAAALITGQRGPVPPEILQAFRDAGLAHILVIAGMHLSMVAGLVLVVLRGLLAAIPWLALRFPIHKWTAAGALLVTFGYLLISGAPVPTQRAFIMNFCVLAAILLDRQAMSLRAISLAALLVLLIQPEALCGASFQLSFAAVYGLIAGYEALGPRLASWRHSARSPWQLPLFYVAGILLTTQIAGSATAFYSLFHFNRYALYSLLGNCLAVPLVGFWVMPSALIGFCLLPFGLDGWGWQGMAAGLDQVSHIAAWVSGLPGATVTAPAMPMLSLVLFSLGAAWLILWRRSWRLAGLAIMAAGVLNAALQRPPDLLIDADFKLIALREADGRLHLSPGRASPGLRQSWARLAGEDDSLPPMTGSSRIACVERGCLIQSGEGDRFIPLDRIKWRESGTHEVWLRDQGLPAIRSVADWQGDRPWRPGSLR